jgi:type IV pilus assembly protein PilZ
MSRSSTVTMVFVHDPDIYLELSKRLGKRGVKVVNVSSGSVALEMIRKLKPALVILGYELQDLPAGEVVRRIKKSPQSRNIPVIILYDPTSDREGEILGLPCDEALARPIDTETLVRKISERLNIPLRRHNRIAIDMDVDCAHHDSRVRGFARNISEGGVFIETNDTVDVGASLTLSFTLPGQPGPLTVPGQVVRRIELERDFRFGLGVEFGQLQADSRQQILEFLIHKSLLVPA